MLHCYLILPLTGDDPRIDGEADEKTLCGRMQNNFWKSEIRE